MGFVPRHRSKFLFDAVAAGIPVTLALNIAAQITEDPGPPPKLFQKSPVEIECKGCGAITELNKQCRYCGRVNGNEKLDHSGGKSTL